MLQNWSLIFSIDDGGYVFGSDSNVIFMEQKMFELSWPIHDDNSYSLIRFNKLTLLSQNEKY